MLHRLREFYFTTKPNINDLVCDGKKMLHRNGGVL